MLLYVKSSKFVARMSGGSSSRRTSDGTAARGVISSAANSHGVAKSPGDFPDVVGPPPVEEGARSRALEPWFNVEVTARAAQFVKGKGEMHLYWIDSLAPAPTVRGTASKSGSGTPTADTTGVSPHVTGRSLVAATAGTSGASFRLRAVEHVVSLGLSPTLETLFTPHHRASFDNITRAPSDPSRRVARGVSDAAKADGGEASPTARAVDPRVDIASKKGSRSFHESTIARATLKDISPLITTSVVAARLPAVNEVETPTQEHESSSRKAGPASDLARAPSKARFVSHLEKMGIPSPRLVVAPNLPAGGEGVRAASLGKVSPAPTATCGSLVQHVTVDAKGASPFDRAVHPISTAGFSAVNALRFKRRSTFSDIVSASEHAIQMTPGATRDVGGSTNSLPCAAGTPALADVDKELHAVSVGARPRSSSRAAFTDIPCCAAGGRALGARVHDGAG